MNLHARLKMVISSKTKGSDPLNLCMAGKHKAAYQAHTVELSTRLAELHGKDDAHALYNKILEEWQGDKDLGVDSDLMKDLKSVLSEAVSQWDKALDPLKQASDQERGPAITKDLHALSKLEKLLSAQIQKLNKPKALKSKEAKEVLKVVGSVLIGLLKDHKQALDRYEQAVLFIGDAANSKDPKQERGK